MDEETNEIEATVINDENGDATAVVVELPEGDGETPPVSDAVAIAQIEAEKEIAVEAIRADVDNNRIEAEAERNENCHAENDRIAALETSLQGLTETIATMAEALASLNQSTPTPPQELAEEAAEEIPAIEIAQEPNSIPQSIVEEETGTEHGAESGEENQEPEAVVIAAVPARKLRRLI